MALILRPESPSRIIVPTVIEEPLFCIDLANQHFEGPEKGNGPYASISILDPVVTIERHGGKYHIAARFNIETTILHYNSKKRDGHEWYFHDICLQYMRPWGQEELVMKPESDPAAAFTVTRSSNNTTSGDVGVSMSQSPSANVSLGMSRSTTLTVEYAMSTWTVSAHCIVNKGAYKVPRPKGITGHLKHTMGKKLSNPSHSSSRQEEARYQWFWAGTQAETQKLTPDLKHTVKRHIVVKRVVPLKEFPTRRVTTTRDKELAEKEVERWRDTESHDITQRAILEAINARSVADEAVSADKSQPPSLEHLLSFEFYIQIRLKRRYGRVHRALLLTTNQVKAAFIEPTYKETFCIGPSLGIRESNIPLTDTADITAVLDEIKNDNGQCDGLQGKRLVNIEGYDGFLARENRWSERLELASDSKRVVHNAPRVETPRVRRRERELINIDAMETLRSEALRSFRPERRENTSRVVRFG